MISQIWSSNEIEAIMRFQDPNRYKRLGKDLSEITSGYSDIGDLKLERVCHQQLSPTRPR